MPTFRLDVQLIDPNKCRFQLSWGKEQRLRPVTLPYPESLMALYQDWERAYLSFYQSDQINWDSTNTAVPNTWLPYRIAQQALRGRAEASGSMTPSTDWHEQLGNLEARLLREFNNWLHSPDELRRIWAKIASAARVASERSEPNHVDVLLACDLELARLPWEAWDIGDLFAAPGVIRIARVSADLEAELVSVAERTRRWRPRVLAIWGDDPGLNFQGDRDAVQSLSHIAEIESISQKPEQTVAELKDEICRALADEDGWDVLFFAGHSDETELDGGKLGLAPGVSLLLKNIESCLRTAKARGLQFAIFNSCSGLSIAEWLIGQIGLSQVAVMRHPIHNQVAQEFLVQFLRSLAAHKDVHESLLTACQYLDKKKYIYPSAYLIPSLFRRPNAPLFRIPPLWEQWLKRISPTRQQAIALVLLLGLSWSLDVQDWLLERRVLMQAVYRQLTAQIPTAPLDILLVQIDEQSIEKAQISKPNPMDREYLGRLVDKLKTLDARVIGIDYLLDRSQGENDRTLAQSLQTAVQDPLHPSWFIFPSVRNYADKGWLTTRPEIASPNWSLQGHIQLSHWYVGLLPQKPSTVFELPFDYLLALAYRLNVEILPATKGQNLASSSLTPYPPQPQLRSQTDFISQVTTFLESEKGQDYRTLFSPSSQLQPITSVSYDLGQMWLHPIIDFSIPPDQVYDHIPAWQLLSGEADSSQLSHLQQQVVIIVPGEYGEAGVFRDGQDNYPLPAAVSYWIAQHHAKPHNHFTGGEAHAYAVHHFLHRRLVVPIPDLWMVGLAILLGKGMSSTLKRRNLRQWEWGMLLGGTAVYGVVSLQAYISVGVLLPWLLPSATFWTYALPMLLRRTNHA